MSATNSSIECVAFLQKCGKGICNNKITSHLVRSPHIDSSNSKTEIFASRKVNIIESLLLPPSVAPFGNTPNDSTLPCNLHHIKQN